MNQLIYLIIIFILTFLVSSIYLWCINLNKIIKILIAFLSIFIFSFVCYIYNCFIFNEYVVITLLYAIYIASVVKMCVKKRLK